MKNEKICTHCGFQNNLNANFCKSCGSALEDVEKSPTEKAEEIKRKVKKRTINFLVTIFILLIKPILKAKVIIPAIVLILGIVFWDNMIDTYKDYQQQKKVEQEKIIEEVKLAKEKIENEKRLAKEKIENEKRLAKEKIENEKRLAKEKIENEKRLAKEKIENEKRLAVKKAINSAGFNTYPSNTYIDFKKKLMWQDNFYTKKEKLAYIKSYKYGRVQNWNGAIKYCKKLSLGGYTDWYLPSKSQLTSLIKINKKLKSTNKEVFWTSTVYSNRDDFAAYVYFKRSEVNYAPKSINYFVRCIRSGK